MDLWDWEGQRAYAEYDHFKVDSEEHKYALHVKFYKGNAGVRACGCVCVCVGVGVGACVQVCMSRACVCARVFLYKWL